MSSFQSRGSANESIRLARRQEFVQILMIPLKKKIAEERLEAAELRVAAETLRLVAEVKAAYFTYQGDQQLLA